MRKSRKQQKNRSPEQLDLFESEKEKLTESTTGGTGKGRKGRVELLSKFEENRFQTRNISEEIFAYVNLNKSYQQVVRNGGSGGTDKMDMSEFKQWYPKGIIEIRKELLTEQYKVSPVLKVEIPKPSGGKRMLGIPTIKDRLIQQSIHQKLTEYYEPHFSNHSYGFRAGRSAHQAIRQSAKNIKEGKEWVVDIDLEKFFDKINHDRLMQRVSKNIGDKRLLRLINQYLKAGIMNDGLTEQRVSGTPQGGPLSPLLSNIVLDELDKELESRGHSFCRYADDCNIYVRSEKAGQRVMQSIVRYIENKLKLKVNKEKSGVRHCSKVKFLGYTIMPKGKIRVADKSIDRLKEKLKELTGRTRGVSYSRVISELNAVIIGWTNYFGMANTWLADIRNIEGWLRRRLRMYRLKQCKRKYTQYKFLRSRGIRERDAWNVVNYSQGWWRMTLHPTVTKAMGIKWFEELGLESLLKRVEGST